MVRWSLARFMSDDHDTTMVGSLGKPLVVMLLVAAVTGSIIFLRPSPQKANLTVWVFTPADQRLFSEPLDGRASLIDQFHQQTGQTVAVELVSSQAIDTRLISMIMSGRSGGALPDLVELEIGSVGKFLRPAIDQIGLLPLNDLLTRVPRFPLAARLTPWSKQGVIFGIPLDVHPVTITYRRDLFEAAGVDPASAETWEQFQAICLAAQRRWGTGRYAIELPRASADALYMMLLQRGVSLLDGDSKAHFTDPRVVQTLMFYAQLVAGSRRIAGEPPASAESWTLDLSDGAVASVMTPDWRFEQLASYAPGLMDKLGMMPLPRFDPGDAPTSTWGGTALAIPRRAANPRRSWELLQWLCLSDAAQIARQQSQILPAVELDPADLVAFTGDAKDPFAGVYARLAPLVPVRIVTPYTTTAIQALALVVSRAADYVDRRGVDGLDSACGKWLAEAQHDLEQLIAFDQQATQPVGDP